MARATHAEESLRSQTELLDEMAELAAQKEAAQALVVTLQQEVEAREGEVARLAESARASAEAAATWQSKASAAVNLLEQRAAAAEAAAGAVRAAAEEKMRILQEGEGAAYARAEEEAVDAAEGAPRGDRDGRRAEGVFGDARRRVAPPRARRVQPGRRAVARKGGDRRRRARGARRERRPGGAHERPAKQGRSSDRERVLPRRGSEVVHRARVPALEALAEDSLPALVELESAGMGAPFHGRYDLIDAPNRRRELTREEAKRLAREASAALPTPRWDPSEEAANKERLPFNPARGWWGRRRTRRRATDPRRPGDTRRRVRDRFPRNQWGEVVLDTEGDARPRACV